MTPITRVEASRILEETAGHPLCTCLYGRLCLSTHPSWNAVRFDLAQHRKANPTCSFCRGLEAQYDQMARAGFDARPGPRSTYSRIRGF